MAVNENIYGNKDSWLKVDNGLATPTKDNLYVVNYNNGDDIDKSSRLDTANSEGKILVNTPVDLSISYIGVDDSASIVKQKWYNVSKEFLSLIPKGNNPVSFNVVSNINSFAYVSEMPTIAFYDDYININAWCYDKVIKNDYSYTNADGNTTFVSYIPSTLSLGILIRVTEHFSNSELPSTDYLYDLYTYVNYTDSNGNHLYQKYPVVIGVFIMPYFKEGENSPLIRERGYIDNMFPIVMNETESVDNVPLLRYAQATSSFSVIRDYSYVKINENILNTRDYNGFLGCIYGGAVLNNYIGSKYYIGVVGDVPNIEIIKNSSDKNEFVQWTEIGKDFTIEDFKIFCMKQTAYLGMFFSDSFDALLHDDYDSDNIYLGIIDDNGITHGEYSNGSANKEQKQWNWASMHENVYDPTKVVIDERDRGDLTSNRNLYTFGHGSKFYQMSVAQFSQLIEFLNTGYKPNQEQLVQDFKGVNPIDYITTVLQYPLPFDPQSISQNVYIGGILVTTSPYPSTTPLTALRLPGSASTFKGFGSIDITPTYNDFRDYEPFTTAILQLPFIGNYTLDLKKFMNHTLTLEYIIDYMTGSCTAQIYLDNIVIDTVEGQIGYTIPLSGISQGEFQNTLQRMQASKRQASYSLIGSVVGAFANPTTALNVVSSADSLASAAYTVEHTAPTPTNISTASALNAFGMDRRARLVFYRSTTPETFNAELYAHTVGNVCISSGKVGAFSGYLECSNADLSNIPCTDSERIELLNMLKSGIYI